MQSKKESQKKPAHKLLDYLTENFDLKSDFQLAMELNKTPSSICKFRSGRREITPAIILAVHERFDIPVKKIKELL